MITSELILMSKYVAESINQTTDCRMFRPHRPLSTAYKTEDAAVSYAVDKGLRGRSILQSVVCLIDSAMYLLIQIYSLDMLLYYYSTLYCTILYSMLYYTLPFFVRLSFH